MYREEPQGANVVNDVYLNIYTYICTCLYIHVCIVMYTENAESECRYWCVRKYIYIHLHVHTCIFMYALLYIDKTQGANVATNV